MRGGLKRRLKAMWVSMVGRTAFSWWLRVGFRLSAWGLGFDVYESRPVSRRTRGSLRFNEPPEVAFYDTELGKQVLEGVRVVWDIGANEGIWSMAIAQRLAKMNRECEIYLFEPNPLLVTKLAEVDFGRAQACVYSSAVGSSNTVGNLLIPEGGSAHGFIDSDPDVRRDFGSRFSGNTRIEESIEVAIDSVDAHVTRGVPVPDLMKVDVEGVSRDVLLGAILTLDSNPNLVVQFEGDYSWMAYRNEMISLLGNREIFRILPSGQVLKLGAGIEDELYAFSNLVAIGRRSP